MSDKPQETPTSIRLQDSDIRIGFLLELETTRLQSRLEATQESAVQFREALFNKYEVSKETHTLSDWLTGFAPVEVAPAPVAPTEDLSEVVPEKTDSESNATEPSVASSTGG